jgi:hypothetical protein
MARTKQTARVSTGGKAPKKQLATKAQRREHARPYPSRKRKTGAAAAVATADESSESDSDSDEDEEVEEEKKSAFSQRVGFVCAEGNCELSWGCLPTRWWCDVCHKAFAGCVDAFHCPCELEVDVCVACAGANTPRHRTNAMTADMRHSLLCTSPSSGFQSITAAERKQLNKPAGIKSEVSFSWLPFITLLTYLPLVRDSESESDSLQLE